VLIYNTEQVPSDEAPTSLLDLTTPRWKGKICLGTPTLGTMATHHAALFQIWGADAAEDYFRALKANDVHIVTGNTAVRDAVARGEFPVGVIDTSDAFEAIADGAPLSIVYPDQDTFGTLVIPNTVALVAGAPHPENGRAFIDYLLRPETERTLAESRSAQMPLHAGVAVPPGLPEVASLRTMAVDFGALADNLDATNSFLTALFLQ